MRAKHDSKGLLLESSSARARKSKANLKSLILFILFFFAVYTQRTAMFHNTHKSSLSMSGMLTFHIPSFIRANADIKNPPKSVWKRKWWGGILIDFWVFDFQMSHFFLPRFCGFKSEAAWGWCRLRIKSSPFRAETQVPRPDLTPQEGDALIGYPASPHCLPSLSHRSAIFLTLPH